jgi:hypothetical protein
MGYTPYTFNTMNTYPCAISYKMINETILNTHGSQGLNKEEGRKLIAPELN